MKYKKADVTTGTLITTIILILGFLVLLLLYSQISFTGKVDKEVCHESVIFRGTLPTTFGVKDYIPLKCKTDKVCVTSKLFGGECKEFEGAKGVTTVRVSSEKDIEKVLAEGIVDCWSMMGEGKVSIFSQYLAQIYGLSDVYPSCVICTRVAFDRESLTKAKIDLNKVDPLSYMTTRLVPGRNITYYEYLVGEGVAAPPSVAENLFTKEPTLPGEVSEEEKKTAEYQIQQTAGSYEFQAEARENLDIDQDSLAIMFMQITSPGHAEAFENLVEAGATALGISFSLKPGAFIRKGVAPVATKLPALKLGGKIISKAPSLVTGTASRLVLTPATKIIAAIAIAVGIFQQANVAWQRGVSAGYCGDVSTGDEARNGCTVVRTIVYEPESINDYCAVIESIP